MTITISAQVLAFLKKHRGFWSIDRLVAHPELQGIPRENITSSLNAMGLSNEPKVVSRVCGLRRREYSANTKADTSYRIYIPEADSKVLRPLLTMEICSTYNVRLVITLRDIIRDLVYSNRYKTSLHSGAKNLDRLLLATYFAGGDGLTNSEIIAIFGAIQDGPRNEMSRYGISKRGSSPLKILPNAKWHNRLEPNVLDALERYLAAEALTFECKEVLQRAYRHNLDNIIHGRC